MFGTIFRTQESAGSTPAAGNAFVQTPATNTGTGLAYFSPAPNTLNTITNGTAGQILQIVGGVPTWTNPTAVFDDNQTFSSTPGSVTLVMTPSAPVGTDGTVNYTVQADITGAATALAGQVPVSNGAGNVVFSDVTMRADNGVSVGVDGRVELGGTLHQGTTITTNGFDLNFNTASATDTQIKDNGNFQAGGNVIANVGLPGGFVQTVTGSTEADPNGNIAVNVNGIISTNRIHAKGTDGTGIGGTKWVGAFGNGGIDEDVVFDSSYPRDSSWNVLLYHLDRGVKHIYNAGRTAITEVRNTIANSNTGQYYLGGFGGSITVSQLPVTSTATTLENLAIDTTNGQIVRNGIVESYVVDVTTTETTPKQVSTTFSAIAGLEVAFTSIAYNNIPAPITPAKLGHKWVADIDVRAVRNTINTTVKGKMFMYLVVNGLILGRIAGTQDTPVEANTWYYNDFATVASVDINQASPTSISIYTEYHQPSGSNTAGWTTNQWFAIDTARVTYKQVKI